MYSGRCDEIDGVDWIDSQEECIQAAQDLGFCDLTIQLVDSSDNPRGCWFGGGGGCCMDGSICGGLYFNVGAGGSSSNGRTSICKVESSSRKHLSPYRTDCFSHPKGALFYRNT